MTLRDFPIIPTIFVVAAAATMVALGIWQIGRADEKAALIAQFEAQSARDEVVEIKTGREDFAYRRIRMECDNPRGWQAVAGRNRRGQTGFAHRYLCAVQPFFDDLPEHTYADIGWSQSPQQPVFDGGVVEGVLVKMGIGFKVIADPALAGLEPLAKPDPNDLPNNHIAYAGQWFFFAITALVIYFLALRSRTARVSRSKSA